MVYLTAIIARIENSKKSRFRFFCESLLIILSAPIWIPITVISLGIQWLSSNGQN